MKNKEKELDSIRDFIRNFDPKEFSSEKNISLSTEQEDEAIKRAQKIKARINRKHKMNDYFQQVLDTQLKAEDTVFISQKEIDELLASAI